MSDHASPAGSGTVAADVVCDFIVDWGSPYARDNKDPFCGKPAAWKWTHAVIKSRGAPDIFDKIVTDYYCHDHGERMQGQGGFGDVGKWEHIADNAEAHGRRSRTVKPLVGSMDSEGGSQ